MSAKSRKIVDNSEINIIINLHKQGKTYSQIASNVNRPKSTIQGVISRYKIEGRTYRKHPPGAKKKLTKREERHIIKRIKENPTLKAKDITKDIKERFNKNISRKTVSRILKSDGYISRISRKKPYISKVNRIKRIQFAKEYINKDLDFWRSVIFSDESKFCIFGCNGQKRVWRKENTALDPKNLNPTVKHGGGGVMVWGCMAAAGVGNLEFINTIMDQHVYINILKENLKESAVKLNLLNNYYFQQDNDPKHTAYKVRMWILYNVRNVLATPPQSPDLNPIEHLWSILEKKIQNHTFTSKSQLVEVIKSEWANISTETTEKLVSSMPKRLEAVIKAKGFPTKY